jgi:uncharacterized protein
VTERPTPEPTRSLAPEARGMFAVEVLGGAVPFAAVAIGLAVILLSGAPAIAISVVAVAAAVGAAIVVPRIRLARFRYEVRDDEIDLRHGLVTVRRTLVPIRRVQHVDTETGPLQSMFDLATVSFHTAAGKTQIPALRRGEAEAVRGRVAALARTRDDV